MANSRPTWGQRLRLGFGVESKAQSGPSGFSIKLGERPNVRMPSRSVISSLATSAAADVGPKRPLLRHFSEQVTGPLASISALCCGVVARGRTPPLMHAILILLMVAFTLGLTALLAAQLGSSDGDGNQQVVVHGSIEGSSHRSGNHSSSKIRGHRHSSSNHSSSKHGSSKMSSHSHSSSNHSSSNNNHNHGSSKYSSRNLTSSKYNNHKRIRSKTSSRFHSRRRHSGMKHRSSDDGDSVDDDASASHAAVPFRKSPKKLRSRGETRQIADGSEEADVASRAPSTELAAGEAAAESAAAAADVGEEESKSEELNAERNAPKEPEKTMQQRVTPQGAAQDAPRSLPSGRNRCGSSCSGHGSCNEALGSCQCLVGFQGDDCSELALPSCQLAAGGGDKSAKHHLSCHLPTTCACLLECDRLSFSHMATCFDETKHDSSTDATGSAPLTLAAMLQLPQLLLLTDGRGEAKKREAAGEGDIVSGFVDPAKCRDSCSNRGVCEGSQDPGCSCPWFYSGEGCADVAAGCLNECSGRGECEEGVCRCEKHFFGIDCSLSLDENQQPRVSLVAPFKWAPSVLPPDPAAPPARPLVFVYELPGYFNTWQFRHSPAIDLPEAVWLLERLLSSPHRTANPDEADFFYVPLFLRNRDFGRERLVEMAIEFISENWPFWKRSQGRNHIFFVAEDSGRCNLHKHEPLRDLLQNSIVLSHWGSKRSLILSSNLHPCFKFESDIVVPPHIDPAYYNNPWILSSLPSSVKPSPPLPDRRVLLLFFDETELPLPPGKKSAFSFGAQQAMVRQFKGKHMQAETGVRVVASDGRRPSLDEMLSAHFCFASVGLSWHRSLLWSVAAGCIPVIAQPGVLQPFEGLALSWEKMAVRISLLEIPNLPRLLTAISPQERESMRDELKHAWPLLTWTSHSHNPLAALPLDKQEPMAEVLATGDALSALMRALGKRLDENLEMDAEYLRAQEVFFNKVQNVSVREEDLGPRKLVVEPSIEQLRLLIDPVALQWKAGQGRVACEEGCYERGTCNEEMGRCDCAPGFVGTSCQTNGLEACKLADWGQTTCYAPATCACHLACEAFHLEHFDMCFDEREVNSLADSDEFNEAEQVTEGGQLLAAVDVRRHAMMARLFSKPTMAVVTDGRGKEMGERFGLGQNFIAGSPYECPEKCNGRGACAVDVRGCWCPAPYRGAACEHQVHEFPFVCMADCSGRGKCVDGTCICERGFFGIDCASFFDDEGKISLLDLPLFLWAPEALPPSLKASASKIRPLIFVYDLPRWFTSWQLLHTVDLERHELSLVLDRALRSQHRTADALEADFFFIPVMLSNWNKNKGVVVNAAIDYIRSVWPFWNASEGSDHLLMVNGDWGACEMGRHGMRNPYLGNVILLTLWGYNQSMRDTDNDACFIAGQDIVAPPLLKQNVFSVSPFVLKQSVFEWHKRDNLLYYQGYHVVNSPTFEDTDFRWSLGERQKFSFAFRRWANVSGFNVQLTDMNRPANYLEDLPNSKFCFAPCGYGWGMRATQAVVLGCIPVVVKVKAKHPFEESGLNWEDFSVMVSLEEIIQLPQILQSLPRAEIDRKLTNLEGVWRKFVWASSQHNPFRDAALERQQELAAEMVGEDAFDTVMAILGKRLKKGKRKGKGWSEGLDHVAGFMPSVAEERQQVDEMRKREEGGGGEVEGVEGGKEEREGEKGVGIGQSSNRRNSKCSSTCREHGTCNELVGRCDCLVGYAGNDCTELAMPSCHLAQDYWTPCNLLSSCSCAVECERFFFAHPSLCFDDTGLRLGPDKPVADVAELFDRGVSVLKSDGKGNEFGREAMKGPKGIVGNFGRPDLCRRNCSGRGVCERNTHVCNCAEAFQGAGCDFHGFAPFVCFNNCSGNGRCIGGVCKCQRGFFGLDCSLSLDDDGKPMLSPPQEVPWASVSAKGPSSATPSIGPKIFVYELPGWMNSWQGQMVGAQGGWEAHLFLDRLLASGHRTADPTEANFFFVPLLLSHRESMQQIVLEEAIQFISSNWPFWPRSNGADHIFVANAAFGSCHVGPHGVRSRPLQRSIVLTTWGLETNHQMELTDPCFIPGQDIVIPPILPPVAYQNIARAAKKQSFANFFQNKDILLFFQGHGAPNEAFDWKLPFGWGIRRKFFELYDGKEEQTKIRIVLNNGEPIDVQDDMERSTFCLCTAGQGWSFWTTQAILAGCIPVIIQPRISLPLKEVGTIPWTKIAVIVDPDDIPKVQQILQGVSSKMIASMQKEILLVWTKVTWSSSQFVPFMDAITPFIASQLANNDVFSSIMSILDHRTKSKNT